jgi:predicted ATPase with chaperone activity
MVALHANLADMIESKLLRLAHVFEHTRFVARFRTVAAMNPHPCMYQPTHFTPTSATAEMGCLEKGRVIKVHGIPLGHDPAA